MYLKIVYPVKDGDRPYVVIKRLNHYTWCSLAVSWGAPPRFSRSGVSRTASAGPVGPEAV